METFRMKYNDALQIAEATKDKAWDVVETFQEEAVEGYERIKYDLQKAYKYYDEATRRAFQYGVGIVSDGLSNGALFVDESLRDTATYLKNHFQVEIAPEDVETFLYNIGSEIYDYFTGEDLPESGLDTAVKLPVTSIENALNLNVPEALYTRIKEYLKMHYSESTGNVTLPNGTTYNNVVGGQFYNTNVNIASTTFSKSWLLDSLTKAVINCTSISATRAEALNREITANIDTIYSDILNRYNTTKGETLSRVYDFVNIRNSRLTTNLYYSFEIYPVQGESTVDYWKGDYGNYSIIDHADGIKSIGVLHMVSGDVISAPILVNMRCPSIEIESNSWEYYGTNWTSGETGIIDPHNYAVEVDAIASLRYTTFSSLPAIPEPTPRPAKNMNFVPFAILPEEDLTIEEAPENPSENPAPLPYPPNTGGLPTYRPFETDIQTGMGAVYNPSIFQVRDLAEYLWTPAFLDLFKKFFSDPKDAIVSLHKVYVTPERGTTDSIWCGYVETPVGGVYKVANQYKHLDCGSIFIPEYYESARDYNASDLKLYLPFIGIVQLDITEFLNKSMHVYYNVDVLTGSCIAFVCAVSGEVEKILYTFNGNCSVTIPISSGSYLTNWQALANSALSLASGDVLGAAMGGASAVKMQVHRSGSLGSNVGAMSPRKPYILISRLIPNEFDRDKGLEVYQLNKPFEDLETFFDSCSDGDKVVISDFVGNVTTNHNAMESEMNELKMLLESGIII